ncbi:hypothetical protein AAAC51_31050 [Priestia megaterium]
MKDCTGFDILSFLRDKTKQLFVPIVMMSVDNQRETRLKAFKLGADDFLLNLSIWKKVCFELVTILNESRCLTPI